MRSHSHRATLRPAPTCLTQRVRPSQPLLIWLVKPALSQAKLLRLLLESTALGWSIERIVHLDSLSMGPGLPSSTDPGPSTRSLDTDASVTAPGISESAPTLSRPRMDAGPSGFAPGVPSSAELAQQGEWSMGGGLAEGGARSGCGIDAGCAASLDLPGLSLNQARGAAAGISAAAMHQTVVERTTSDGAAPLLGPQRATLCLVRKPASATARTPDPTALQEQLEAVLDGWYVEQSPFLTPEREAALRAAWAQAVAARGTEASCDRFGCSGAQSCEGEPSYEDGCSWRADALPSGEAYRLVFTRVEQTEISFRDFDEELFAFRALPTDAPTAALSAGRAEESGDAPVASQPVDLETVIDFLRATQ